jgi:hypothetical protein
MRKAAIDVDLADLVQNYQHDFRPRYSCQGAKWRAHKWKLERYWPTRVEPPWPATVKVVGTCTACGDVSVCDFKVGLGYETQEQVYE